MQLAGKLSGWGVVGAIRPSSLAHISDELSGARFLIDTGSSFSIIPYSSPSTPSGPSLQTAGGQPISCWGHSRRTIRFHGHSFTWDFLLAAVKFPILGSDFLKHFKLWVDPAGGRLLNSQTWAAIPADPSTSAIAAISTPAQQEQNGPTTLPPAARGPNPALVGSTPPQQGLRGPTPLPPAARGPNPALVGSTPPQQGLSGPTPLPPAARGPSPALVQSTPTQQGLSGLTPPPPAAKHPQPSTPPLPSPQGPSSSRHPLLDKYEDVLNADGRLPPSTHGVEHHIITEGRPVTAKFRRLDNEKLAAAKAEFDRMEAEGIVRRSNSNWSSPLHMVMKPDGSWRPCGNFRRLNAMTEADCYPLPNMTNIISNLAGQQIFSKLDLKKGYHQVPVHEADIRKTAIITPFGLYEFRRTSFGLKNAGMTFQRFMDQVLVGLPFVIVYLDQRCRSRLEPGFLAGAGFKIYTIYLQKKMSTA